jgi:hypothetical protein
MELERIAVICNRDFIRSGHSGDMSDKTKSKRDAEFARKQHMHESVLARGPYAEVKARYPDRVAGRGFPFDDLIRECKID